MQYRVISADCHIIEPPGTFVDRVPAHLKDRAPRIMRAEDGGDGWSWDGKPPKEGFLPNHKLGGQCISKAAVGLSAVAGRPYDAYKSGGIRFEEIIPGNYDGKAHLEDMRKDGVDASAVYPGTGNRTYTCPDRELALACLRAYNDWLIDEFCGYDPAHLISLPILPVDDGMDVTIQELRRVAKKGAKGLFVPGCPARPYQDPYYDPLWAEAQSAGLSINFHRNHGGRPPAADQQDDFVAGVVIRFFSAIRPLTNLIFTGVFDRFPNLHVVAAETNMGWVPFWIEEMENEYERQRHWAKLPMTKSPREYAAKHIHATFLVDTAAFRCLDMIPADLPMYSTDYPHSVTIWPHSKEIITKLTKGVQPQLKHKLLAGNAVDVYHLN